MFVLRAVNRNNDFKVCVLRQQKKTLLLQKWIAGYVATLMDMRLVAMINLDLILNMFENTLICIVDQQIQEVRVVDFTSLYQGSFVTLRQYQNLIELKFGIQITGGKYSVSDSVKITHCRS